ncbi:MAG: MopE-related protein, partial [Myxococcota bacterium]|nr:MopE-related protein [Myxococcota bacterium]
SADERCDGIDNDCDGQIDEGTRTTVYRDEDGDGFGDPTAPSEACGASDGYVDNRDDCDDTSAAARPGGIEVCDGVDNDCDALTDEDDAMDARTFYADVDGDGFGDPDNTTRSCALGVGYVDQARDCNDMDPDIRPGADEVCDGVDNDCDTLTDDTDQGVDRATGGTWYGDGDGDGYGDPAAGAWACTQPSGSVTDDTDCDDTSAAIHPGAPEVCNGGVDDDCDGYADDADVDVDLDTGTTWYADDDGDSYGDATDATRACVQPSATVGDATDCDDDDAGVHPGAVEVCNGGVDDDCNGDADDADAGVDLGTGTLWYIDDDDDGYGDAADGTPACAQPTGRVADGTDCDDTDGGIHPGTAEVWYDGVDADCGGDDDYDADADGAPSYAEAAGPDCADADPTVQDCGGSAASAGESCASILDSDATLGDGAYWVDPDGLGAFQVDCDMTTDGGGWVELELDSSDAVLVYQYSSSNPWRKCADDAAQHFHHTGTETTVAVDGNIAGAGPVDVTLTYLQPSTGTAYSIAEAEALRSVVGELHPGTRMVALTADDDGGSYEDGDTYGHEVYASDEGGTWTVLTPGTNGECGGSSSWPQAGSQSAFYLWATDPVDAAVSGTTGMTSGLMPSLPATLVMPVQIRFVVATGGGVAFGWEEAVFLVR